MVRAHYASGLFYDKFLDGALVFFVLTSLECNVISFIDMATIFMQAFV